jgi:hypothetical protein
MVVYITKQWEPCECKAACDYTIDLVFMKEADAEKRAEELYQGFYTVEQVIE